MQNLKYSQESFGYLLDFPDGSFGLYDAGVAPLIPKYGSGQFAKKESLDPFLLDQISIHQGFHLSKPLVVWLEVTRACNLDCSHCYIRAGRARRGELTTAEWKAVIDDLHQLGTFSIVFAGGEPFLRRDFIEILNYATDLGFTISVVTNGHYLTKQVLGQLQKDKIRITLSVDGIAAHNKIRGGDSTFELMQEKLYLMKSEGIQCSVSTVISKVNIHELEEMLDWCISEDIVFRTVTFNSLGRGIENRAEHALSKEDAILSAEIFAKQKRFESKKDKDIGRCVSKYFEYALSLMYTTKMEHCSRSIAYIASDGGVYPCVSAASTNTFGAGNVRQVSFSYLWQSSFQDMRSITWKKFKSGPCSGCDLNDEKKYFCANRCPVMSLVLNNQIFGCGASEFDKQDLRERTTLLKELVAGA